MTQPTALFLADVIDADAASAAHHGAAAYELRRLHEEVERLTRERDALLAEQAEDQGVIAVWRRRTQQAEAQRDALLEALHAMLSHTAMLDPSQGFDGFDHSAVNQARAAIKAVEGEKT